MALPHNLGFRFVDACKLFARCNTFPVASNLCRCTGYQNIIKALKAARDAMRERSPA